MLGIILNTFICHLQQMPAKTKKNKKQSLPKSLWFVHTLVYNLQCIFVLLQCSQIQMMLLSAKRIQQFATTVRCLCAVVSVADNWQQKTLGFLCIQVRHNCCQFVDDNFFAIVSCLRNFSFHFSAKTTFTSTTMFLAVFLAPTMLTTLKIHLHRAMLS